MIIAIDVPDKRVLDCLNGAGSRYWARDLVMRGDRGSVVEHADGKPIQHMIGPRKLRRGVAALAKLAPRRFEQLCSEDWDAETGDVLLQLVVLGEIKYA